MRHLTKNSIPNYPKISTMTTLLVSNLYYAYLFIKMEVVSCGEAKLTAAGLPDWLISI